MLPAATKRSPCSHKNLVNLIRPQNHNAGSTRSGIGIVYYRRPPVHPQPLSTLVKAFRNKVPQKHNHGSS
jgi:hypothetical protein